MNKFTFGAAAAALALMAPVAAHAQNLPPAVIAVVDRDRIASTCTQCTAASQQLQAQVQAFQQRAQALSTPLQTEQQAIATALRALPQGQQPDAALQQRIQAFQAQQQAAETELGPRQETLRRNQAFVVQQILERMDPLIGQVVRQRGANLAIDVGSTIAHNPQLDITDAVLQLMNANTTPFNLTAPAPQQQPTAQPPAQQPPRPQGR